MIVALKSKIFCSSLRQLHKITNTVIFNASEVTRSLSKLRRDFRHHFINKLEVFPSQLLFVLSVGKTHSTKSQWKFDGTVHALYKSTKQEISAKRKIIKTLFKQIYRKYLKRDSRTQVLFRQQWKWVKCKCIWIHVCVCSIVSFAESFRCFPAEFYMKTVVL